MSITARVQALLAATLVLALHADAPAQLVPEREYYGINRRMPMVVQIPDDHDGEIEIRLLEPLTASTAESAAAAAGRVDLASLFPSLWRTDEPRLLYAQLYLNERPTGPAVVLQPMVTPNHARLINPTTLEPTLDPRRGRPIFEDERLRLIRERGAGARTERPVTYSGIRAYTDRHVVFDTTHGQIEFRMRPDHAPNTVASFIHLVEGGFYTDVIFHRVVAALVTGDPFVIQVGDPTGTGTGGPGFFIDLEPSRLEHRFGVLSMARSSDPNSNGSQVFICLSRAGTRQLDGAYTAFAQAVRGETAIHAIAGVPVLDNDRPRDPPVIRQAFTTPAPPYGTGPEPLQEPRPEPPVGR